MNLYYIDSGEIRYFAKKTEAEIAAQEEADKIQKGVILSKLFIATDRDNIARMANRENGFTKFVGRVCTVNPRKRPRLKLRPIAAVTSIFMLLVLPNPSDAANCTTRRSGSVSITSCSGKGFSSQCRSYRSGSVIKTYCQ